MLNKFTIQDESVSNYIEMMIWLSAQFGPVKKPVVPKIIKPNIPLHERHWTEDDPRTVFAWAEAEAVYMAKLCNMENWPIQVAPNADKAKLHLTSAKTGFLKPLKSDAWCADKYPGYFVDYFGRPTFFYDPRRCSDLGYFAKTLLPQFALLKIYAKHPPAEFDNSAIDALLHMTACHMGFGFTLLAMSQNERSQSWTPMAILNAHTPDFEELPYLYGTLIGLAAHRLTREQIIATYGPIITHKTRKHIGAALDQIESQSDILKLLRLFCKPTHSGRPEHSLLHQVQSSAGLG